MKRAANDADCTAQPVHFACTKTSLVSDSTKSTMIQHHVVKKGACLLIKCKLSQTSALHLAGLWSAKTNSSCSRGFTDVVQAYPLDLVRTRLAAQTTSTYYTGIWHALSTIVKDEGLFGLYRGLGATLTQVAPSLAINYCTYETLRSYWLTHEPGRQAPTVSCSFVGACIDCFSACSILSCCKQARHAILLLCCVPAHSCSI
jgi:hypothetical protein